MFDVAVAVATTHRNAHGKTPPEVIRDTINALATEIDTKYGDGKGGIDWQMLLDDNM